MWAMTSACLEQLLTLGRVHHPLHQEPDRDERALEVQLLLGRSSAAVVM
jgi:hypothetical protein